MPTRKNVILRCHEPIAQDLRARQPWGDIDISFKTRPGREPERYGPTLIGRVSLEEDIETAKRIARRQSGSLAAEFRAQAEELEQIAERLRLQPILLVAEGEAWDQRVPNIYTASEWIDRAEAEAMLRVLLTRLGYAHVRFTWKRPSIIFIPS